MKSINTLNKENENTDIFYEKIDFDDKWIPFSENPYSLINSDEKIESGRGGELLKKSCQFSEWTFLDVKCSQTDITGKLYWRHPVNNTIDRIVWDDGVVKKY